MERKEWAMQEDFIFPEEAGLPAEMEKLVVTPRFTEERTEDGVRLTGIYHIAATIGFEQGERAEGDYTSAVLIDDVDLDGASGYFEYAVPLHIDLPPEVASPLHVETTSSVGTADGQGSLKVVWNVECSYHEVEVPSEEVIHVQEIIEMPSAQNVAELVDLNITNAATATNDSTSFTETDEVLSFIADLEDGYSTSTFRSNDVLVKNET